jgi:O-antigen/teichoic acid export membrane protein
LIEKIKKIFQSGDDRTALIKKNIVGSFGLKIVDVVVDFLLVPLSLAYLTQTDYGIWLIINSMVSWLNFFDIGISHGYRNKLAIALSNKDFDLAKKYTSTTYMLVFLISLAIAIFAAVAIPFVDWSQALNTKQRDNEVLSMVMLIVVVSYAVQLVLKIISSVFLANQLPIWNSVLNTVTKVGTALFVGLLISYTANNLYYYALVFSLFPLVIFFVSTLFFFQKKYKAYRPSLLHFDKSKINELMGLGIKFFIIQLGATMLFMTDNIIIAHVLTPADVTPYQIALKYFSVVMVGFSIFIAPYWSAITEAFSKNEFDWIEKSITTLNKIWGLGVLFTLVLLALFYPVLRIWVGSDIHVPFILAVQCVLFVVLQTQNNIYTFFLNGTGKIFLQMLTGILTLIINIPLSIFFAKYLNLGSAGVLLATNCSILMYVVTRKIQYHKIINGTADGIWAK